MKGSAMQTRVDSTIRAGGRAAPRESAEGAVGAHRVALMRIGFGLIWAIDAWYKWKPDFLSGFGDEISRPVKSAPTALQPWFQFWQNLLTPARDVLRRLHRAAGDPDRRLPHPGAGPALDLRGRCGVLVPYLGRARVVRACLGERANGHRHEQHLRLRLHRASWLSMRGRARAAGRWTVGWRRGCHGDGGWSSSSTRRRKCLYNTPRPLTAHRERSPRRGRERYTHTGRCPSWPSR